MFSPKGMELERGWPGRIDGDTVVQLAAQTLQVFFTAGGALREHAVFRLRDVNLRAPVMYPPEIRVFDGDDFAFANTAMVRGPEDEIAWPDGADELHTGPAIAAVIGADGAIGGFTGANAWTAPGLPGAKQSDFALSVGPVLVTADEYGPGPEWERRRELASRNTVLRPGDLLIAGYAPGEPLTRGDTVELDVPMIGVLRNPVAPASGA
jgi:2-keto-4-pentenoate hydratase/2-oxohepta-3-ene-1,7-dioic acid hydratase in catechol pathway